MDMYRDMGVGVGMSVNTGGAEQKMIEQLHSRLDWTIEDNAKKAIQIADLQARVTELEHKEIHYLQMLEDEGIDSSSAKQSEVYSCTTAKVHRP